MFLWTPQCQNALVKAPIFIRLDFTEPFILDVDWSTCGVGTIFSQQKGRK